MTPLSVSCLVSISCSFNLFPDNPNDDKLFVILLFAILCCGYHVTLFEVIQQSGKYLNRWHASQEMFSWLSLVWIKLSINTYWIRKCNGKLNQISPNKNWIQHMYLAFSEFLSNLSKSGHDAKCTHLLLYA